VFQATLLPVELADWRETTTDGEHCLRQFTAIEITSIGQYDRSRAVTPVVRDRSPRQVGSGLLIVKFKFQRACLSIAMNKVKTGILAAASVAFGIVTLRKLRNRGEEPHEEVEEAVEEAQEELDTAADHATAAAGHARVAVEKALEERRQEPEKAE